MDYQVFEPSDDLAPFVKCYWTLESPKQERPEQQVIVPDGCMEMIFHYGDLYKQYAEDGTHVIQPQCFVIGQLTRPLTIEPTGETGIFSVRFFPDGFLPFTVIPLKEMANTAIPLEKLFGAAGPHLEKQMLGAHTTAARIKYIEAFLLARLTDKHTVDRIVKSTVDTIVTANGRLSVNELSEQRNISRRHLVRKFSSAVGLSPKQLSKTIRLQATLKMMLRGETTSLTSVAYENQYYDQAHFTNDFKELTGYSPKDFYGENLKMSSLFYGKD